MNKLKKEILKLHEQFPWFLPMFRIFHYKYYRGLYVNFLYRKYYKEAMEKYTECTTQFRNIEDLTVDIFRPGRDVNDFQFSQECITLIKKISKEVSEKIKYTENCYFFPPIDRSKAPEFVKDVSEVKEKKVLTAQLKEPLKIQLLNNLIREVAPILEREYYGSNILIDKVYIYRSIESNRREEGSWLWHFDNHPDTVSKMVIYLNDVDVNNGPLTFTRHEKTSDIYKYSSIPGMGKPFFPTRVSEKYMDKLGRLGYVEESLVGPCGTAAIFNENIAHRATVAKNGHRDAIFLMIRPSHKEIEFPISKKYTGSFDNEDLIMNPYQYMQKHKTNKASE